MFARQTLLSFRRCSWHVAVRLSGVFLGPLSGLLVIAGFQFSLAPGIVPRMRAASCLLRSEGSSHLMWLYWRVSKCVWRKWHPLQVHTTGLPKRSGETCLEINSATLEGEVSDDELSPAHFHDDSVTNLVIVLQFKHPDRSETAVILHSRPDAIPKRSLKSRAKRHGNKTTAGTPPGAGHGFEFLPTGDSESPACGRVAGRGDNIQKPTLLQVGEVRFKLHIVMCSNKGIVARVQNATALARRAGIPGNERQKVCQFLRFGSNVAPVPAPANCPCAG